MPELPEVETVCRGLSPFLIDQKIETFALRRPNLRFPFPVDFAGRVQGARITHIGRRAKYILKYLDNDLVWMTHLGMSGRYTVLPDTQSQQTNTPGAFYHQPDTQIGKHDHLEAGFGNGVRLIYTDPRRFGYMDLIAAEKLWDSPHFAQMGLEPLGNAFDAASLYAALATRATPIKNALLDQRIVAGLGNIYVCEALYRSGISPRRKAKNISRQKIEQLVPNIRIVLEAAIAAGGSSLRDFAGAQGSAGYFQHQFDVYGREGETCSTPNCNAIIKRIVQAGRSSFYCPKCQR
ncbi:MAG: bifunctional DNA-formamidopyrimidine glycosylase/DNA-(apurinic or apyrimidinic site) lyase [Parvibaculales bacterium]